MASKKPTPTPFDRALDAYTQWCREHVVSIDMARLGADDVHLPFTEVYVPLRCRRSDRGEHLGSASGGLIGEGPGAPSELEIDELFTHRDIGAPHRVLLGEPGSGKTTALKKLMQLVLDEGPVKLGLLASTVALFFPLKRITKADLEEELGLVELLQRQLASEWQKLAEEDVETERPPLPNDFVRTLWERGPLLLLLDGLDEIADPALRQGVCDHLDAQLHVVPASRGARAVISCRNAGLGTKIDGQRVVALSPRFAACELRALDEAKVAGFVQAWFDAAKRSGGPAAKEKTKGKAKLVREALAKPPYTEKLGPMVATPLLLAQLCVIAYKGIPLPKERAAFYDTSLKMLLEKCAETLPQAQALQVLRTLAFYLHQNRRSQDLSVLDFSLCLAALRPRCTELPSDRIVLDALHRGAGVLQKLNQSEYGFAHHTYQEYLCAFYLAAETNDAKRFLPLFANAEDDWWREVALLAAGMSGYSAFVPLVAGLLEVPSGKGTLPTKRFELLREILTESNLIELAPFLQVLRDPTRELADRCELLQLWMHRKSDALLDWVREARGAAAGDALVPLLDRYLSLHSPGHAGQAAPARRVAILTLPGQQSLVELLRPKLSADIRLWPDPWIEVTDPAWQESFVEASDTFDAALLLVSSADDSPWQHRALATALALLRQRGVSVQPAARAKIARTIALPPEFSEPEWFLLDEADDAASVLATAAARPIAEAPRFRFAESFVEEFTGLRMLWVPGAEFEMGDDDLPRSLPVALRRAAQPVHRVRVSGFWMAETPVTNELYDSFRSKSKTRIDARPYRTDRRFSDPQQPVVGVSWFEARAFAEWLKERSGLEFALPREAERELATRGTDGRKFAWGNDRPDETRAVFGQDQITGRPADVGSRLAGRGPFDHLDLAGNVWEWCEDAWDEKAYRKRTRGWLRSRRDPSIDPMVDGPEKQSTWRVCRGGCWRDPADKLRAAFRGAHAGGQGGVLGFRVVVRAARL